MTDVIVIKFKEREEVFIVPYKGNEELLEHKVWTGTYLNRKIGLKLYSGFPYFDDSVKSKYRIEFITITNKVVSYESKEN